MVDGLLMKGRRILIPASMQQDILDKIHQGHQGMVKCMARAHEAVWWPGLTNQIREKVRQCEICAKETQNATEPLMTPTRFTQNGGKQDWALAYFAYVYPSVCVCMRTCVL